MAILSDAVARRSNPWQPVTGSMARLGALFIVTVATFLLVSTQTAVGEVMKRTDPARDVVQVIDRNDDGHGFARVRPAWKHGDIRSLRVDHALRRVFVALKFRNINPRVDTVQNLVFRTGQATFSLQVWHKGRHIDRFESALYDDTRDRFVACPGRRMGANAAKDRVRVSVPRACIGRPRWVRVGAATWGLGDDDALRRGRNDDHVNSYASPPPALGPRLFRGPGQR